MKKSLIIGIGIVALGISGALQAQELNRNEIRNFEQSHELLARIRDHRGHDNRRFFGRGGHSGFRHGFSNRFNHGNRGHGRFSGRHNRFNHGRFSGRHGFNNRFNHGNRFFGHRGGRAHGFRGPRHR